MFLFQKVMLDITKVWPEIALLSAQKKENRFVWCFSAKLLVSDGFWNIAVIAYPVVILYCKRASSISSLLFLEHKCSHVILIDRNIATATESWFILRTILVNKYIVGGEINRF